MCTVKDSLTITTNIGAFTITTGVTAINAFRDNRVTHIMEGGIGIETPSPPIPGWLI